MKLNKRALIVEGVVVYIIATGMFGVIYFVSGCPVADFIAGLISLSIILGASGWGLFGLYHLIRWINEE